MDEGKKSVKKCLARVLDEEGEEQCDQMLN